MWEGGKEGGRKEGREGKGKEKGRREGKKTALAYLMEAQFGALGPFSVSPPFSPSHTNPEPRGPCKQPLRHRSKIIVSEQLSVQEQTLEYGKTAIKPFEFCV